MSYIDNLKLSEEFVQQYIKPNGSGAITAQVLQNVLMNMLEAAENDILNGTNGLQRYIDQFIAATGNIADGAVTAPKLANAAVTTQKINNLVVTADKLGLDVTSFLLTEDMKEWILAKMGEDKQEEAQALFDGRTENAGVTNFIYGDYSVYEMTKDVIVSLLFNGRQVLADVTPDGWSIESGAYVNRLSIEGRNNVPSAMFTYTIPDGEYAGYKVKYNSESGEVTRTNPVWWGFVPTNNKDDLNSGLIAGLSYSTEDVEMHGTTLANDLASNAYFCVITKASAAATQLGISVLDYPKMIPDFASPRRSSVIMEGYYVYFSKNTIAAGSSLGNVDLSIIC